MAFGFTCTRSSSPSGSNPMASPSEARRCSGEYCAAISVGNCWCPQARRAAIDEQLRGLHPLPHLAPTDNRKSPGRVAASTPTVHDAGRAVLQRVLRGRIVFTPKGEGYTFEAPTRFDKLFSGIVVQRPTFIANGNGGAAHIGPKIPSTATMVGYWSSFTLKG
jgi:hypothetical protein